MTARQKQNKKRDRILPRRSRTYTPAIWRLFLIAGIFSGIALLLVGRLYQLQVVHRIDFAHKADNQYIREQSALFDRGKILFSNHNGPELSAARVNETYTLYIGPNLIEDPEGVYSTLSDVIDIDRSVFDKAMKKKDDPYEVLKTRVTADGYEAVNELDLVGIGLQKERWRFYPSKTLAAQTIGFVSYQDDDTIPTGSYGLERYYDAVLSRGQDNLYVNFFAEAFSGLRQTLSTKRKEGEVGDLVLTIDQHVQDYTEDVLNNYVSSWAPDHTGAIIMDPKTGAVLAASSAPTFDLNKYGEVDTYDIYRNPLIENAYEMGSIIKPLTMAAGLDSGAITEKSTYTDPGYIVIEGSKISNLGGKDRGVVGMQDVLSRSLNVGVSTIMQRMGTKEFSKYFKSFGMDERTGIDLPAESDNIVGNLDSPRQIEYATASFGQGIALTPIATIRSLAVLANRGQLVTPHVVKEIRYKNGQIEKLEQKPGKQVLKPETTEQVSKMLVNYVDETLVYGNYSLDDYSVTAKTGTAQIARPDGEGYYDGKELHSFTGYFPAYDPQFIILLYSYNPKYGARSATQTWTEHYFDLVNFLINYYEVPPDR